MKWGINVNVQDGEKFLAICNDAGLKYLRLNCDIKCSITPILEKIAEYGMKAYIVPMSFKSDRERDCVCELPKSYLSFSSSIPSDICLGIALPENSYLITRPWCNVGLKRSALIAVYNEIVDGMKAQGHRAVLSLRAADVLSTNWKDVKADVFDVEFFLGPKHIDEDARKDAERLRKCADRGIWVGKAGRAGGTILAAQQQGVLAKVQDYAKAAGAEYAFLWSDKDVSRFHWSSGGKFNTTIGK